MGCEVGDFRFVGSSRESGRLEERHEGHHKEGLGPEFQKILAQG